MSPSMVGNVILPSWDPFFIYFFTFLRLPGMCHVHENYKFLCFQQDGVRQILWFPSKWAYEGSTTWNGEETVKLDLWVKHGSWTIPRNCDLALPIDLCTTQQTSSCSYAHRMCGSGFTQMFRPWTAHRSIFTGVSPSLDFSNNKQFYGLKIIPKSVITLIDALFVFIYLFRNIYPE